MEYIITGLLPVATPSRNISIASASSSERKLVLGFKDESSSISLYASLLTGNFKDRFTYQPTWKPELRSIRSPHRADIKTPP